MDACDVALVGGSGVLGVGSRLLVWGSDTPAGFRPPVEGSLASGARLVALGPVDGHQCWCAASDGMLVLWDVGDGGPTVVATHRLACTTHAAAFVGGAAFLAVSAQGNQAVSRITLTRLPLGLVSRPGHALCSLRRVMLDTGASTSMGCVVMGRPRVIGAGAEGTLVGMARGRSLWLLRRSHAPWRVRSRHAVSALAVHPIAIGDETGRLTIYPFSGEGAGDKTVLHWHAHAVLSLAWAPDGSVLCSGGQEGVLVTWRSSDWRRFVLPRLGGALRRVCWGVPDTLSMIVAADPGTLHVICTRERRVVRSVHHVQFGANQGPTALSVAEFGTGAAVALLGISGVVRLYDPGSGRHVRVISLPTAPAAVSAVQDEPLPRVAAEMACFGAGAKWMVLLVCVRPYLRVRDTITAPQLMFFTLGLTESSEVHLLLPVCRIESCVQVLDTVIDGPHSPSTVTALAAHPQSEVACTTGEDGTVRWWRGGPMKGGDGICWACSALTRWGDRADGACFSPDGSVLVCSQGDAMTAWSVETATLLRVFHGRVERGPFSNVSFLACGRRTVMQGPSSLVVFDIAAVPNPLLPGPLLWETKMGVDCWCPLPGPHRSREAALCVVSGGRVLLMAAEEPRVVASWDLRPGPRTEVEKQNDGSKDAPNEVGGQHMDEEEDDNDGALGGVTGGMEEDQQGADPPSQVRVVCSSSGEMVAVVVGRSGWMRTVLLTMEASPRVTVASAEGEVTDPPRRGGWRQERNPLEAVVSQLPPGVPLRPEDLLVGPTHALPAPNRMLTSFLTSLMRSSKS